VIVKKIAVSKVAAVKSKAAIIRSLVDYIAGARSSSNGEKVEHRGATNLLNIDHDGQMQEMIDVAEIARRSAQPVQHWILSWREGEQPTRVQADEAVRMFIDEMGLSEHQAIYALHRDTHNWHLHLAINRVHPETEKLVTVNKGFDHEVAHRAIARIEVHQGWEREAHGVYEPRADGRIERVHARTKVDRQPSGRARDFEERAGERSAQRIAIDDAALTIRRARSWRELHDGLAAKAMRFEQKGSGALLWVGEQPVKASAAGRDCSMAALRKRLGEFEPPPLAPPRLPVYPRAVEPSASSFEAYAQERARHNRDRVAARARAIDTQREQWRLLAERLRKERADVLRGSWKGRGDLLNATRSMLAARQAQEKAEVRERQELERAALRRELGRFPDYEQWLTRRDRDRANEGRYRDRRPPTLEGPTFEQPVPRDIRAYAAARDGWKVHYQVAGSRRQPAFTDRGQTIDIHDSRNRETVLAALQLSAQKWGAISVRGNEQFKRTCVELAAEHAFKIVNPDLQHEIAAQRERLRATREVDVPGPPVGSQAESLTPDAIYRRHLADILRERPHRRRADPSRLDAEVAVRLAVTGHSREQIAKTICDGARGARPREKRDWHAYGQRAASYAFSPPGEQMRARLRDREQGLLLLEGRQDERDLLRRLGGPLRHL
jgi:MobA/VirD2-like, nuclease domain/Large polyvalent protein-associated domain 7/TraI-like middle domain/RepB DNA-primase C-terminal helical domain